MSNAYDTEKTVVVATYASRRNAEIARDYLIAADIQSFVSADDAGGMHPQLQRPHGVKVMTLGSAAEQAYAELESADLLPESAEATAPESEEEIPDDGTLTFSMSGMAGTLGAVAVLLILLWFLSRVP
jgi:hypothetical protein